MNKYEDKDIKKWKQASKFIGYGCSGSSTEKYRLGMCKGKANIPAKEGDVIFISVNGNRPNRKQAPWELIEEAAAVENVAFITDKAYDRNRSYNIGEREVAAFLTQLGYSETEDGFWQAI